MSESLNLFKRIRCPDCLSLKIREIQDKSRIIFYDANGIKFYAMKKVCLDCKYEWK